MPYGKYAFFSCRHIIVPSSERRPPPPKLPIIPKRIKWLSQLSIQNDHSRESCGSVLYKACTSSEINTIETWAELNVSAPLGSPA
jgi:hypothetical protein